MQLSSTRKGLGFVCRSGTTQVIPSICRTPLSLFKSSSKPAETPPCRYVLYRPSKSQAEVYRAFAELAAKQNRGGAAAIEEPSAPVAAQPKEPGGREKQRQVTMPATLTSSPRDPLRTIDEGISEEGSPVPPPPATGSKDVIAAKVEAEGSIWEGEPGRSVDDEEVQAGGDGDGDGGGEAKETASSSSQQDRQQPPYDDDAEEKTCSDTHDAATTAADDDDDETPVRYTPAPRTSAGVVPIGFTTRLFPTPLRESKVADESAWIMKNRRHLHKNHSLVGRLPQGDSESTAGGADGLPVDISESDPVWLKGRGDDLYRGGDFLGAVNAYTAALDADPKAAGCLSNRAASYLRLSITGGGGNGDGGRSYVSACVADCGAALDILQALPETGPSQAKVLARRSLAYRELGHYSSSLEDSRAALLFSPGDGALLEEIARGEPLARAEACKKDAATRFASGDIRGACEMYTAALEAVPSFPSALSNRAACYLALGKPRECVRDCTAVLEMLSVSVGGDDSRGLVSGEARRTTDGLTTATVGPREEHAAVVSGHVLAPSSSPPPPPPPAGSMPPPGSEKRTKWVLTTMLRRARANVQLKDLGGALRDYRAADSVMPGNKEVEKDIRELEREMERPLEPLNAAAS